MVALTYLCLTVALAARTVGAHISSTTMALGDTLHKINLEVDELHRLTLEAALTAAEARKASVKESAMLDQWNAQIATTMRDVQVTMTETAKTVASIRDATGEATSTLQTTRQTIQALQAPINQATATLQAAQSATGHLDALLSDPQLTATIANVEGVTGHLDATAKDVQETVHSYTHPTWVMRVWEWSLDLAHALNPL